jgi:cytochrome c-type biogenesis protein CcmF
MIPELGHFALILALLVALVQGTLPLAGAARGSRAWIAVARPAARAGVPAGRARLRLPDLGLRQPTTSRCSTSRSNSNSRCRSSTASRGVWGGHEGSLLLWVFMLSGWTLAVAVFSRHLPDAMVARVLGVLGLITVGFLLFILLTSNPFERLLPAAEDGRDLNPLLQDPGLVFHPPMLYMGYVGFSVAFAFAIAALLSGQLDAAWARWSRPWTTAAWIFLTLGIALGSWWAYYELGWGGWWFWDPVENASFMPWLVGTALMHSLAVTEKRGSFKNWTVLLAIAAFSLSLLGTFLVRSGVLTSVHAFATDPRRGVFILIFLAHRGRRLAALFAWRAPKVGLGGRFGLVSRESAAADEQRAAGGGRGTVLLGTLYPLFIDALGLGKLSVGPPYFDAVFVPLMVPLLLLMGPGRWRAGSTPTCLAVAEAAVGLRRRAAARRRRAPALRRMEPLTALGLLLAAWIVRRRRCRQRRPRVRAPGGGLSGQPRSWWGMHLAHLGVAAFVVGVTMVSVLSGGEGRAHGAGRHGQRGRLHLPLHRRAQGDGAELPAHGGGGGTLPRRQGAAHDEAREARLPPRPCR